MLRLALPLATLLALPLTATAGDWLPEQRFDLLHPLAAAPEFSRRVFSPTTHDRLERFQAYIGRRAIEHTVDLAEEHFGLFVPERQPERGYGVMVFVSPLPEWPLSREWRKALDRAGIIWVAARRSGNLQNVYERRIPLALHALANVQARFSVDRERVYIAGFSGGSRTAIRIAAAYADLFTGALLMGGAKVMGEEDFAPPPAGLMSLLQRRMRVVYSTGREDMPNLRLDARSADALRERCVAGVFRINERGVGHAMPDRRTLEQVLARLEAPLAESDLLAQERCMAALAPRIEADLVAIDAAIEAGDLTRAGELLGAADLAWGGLVGEQLVRYARRLAPGPSASEVEPASKPTP